MASASEAKSIYDFVVKDARGNDVSLSQYKGKVLLIVNVASHCGLTNSNNTELSELYPKYKDQELGPNEPIVVFACTRFKAEFPIFDKIEVNGESASPLYKLMKLGKWVIFGDDIQWNFAKFLVDRNGQAVGRYYPMTSPLRLECDIQKLLGVA